MKALLLYRAEVTAVISSTAISNTISSNTTPGGSYHTTHSYVQLPPFLNHENLRFNNSRSLITAPTTLWPLRQDQITEISPYK